MIIRKRRRNILTIILLSMYTVIKLTELIINISPESMTTTIIAQFVELVIKKLEGFLGSLILMTRYMIVKTSRSLIKKRWKIDPKVGKRINSFLIVLNKIRF